MKFFRVLLIAGVLFNSSFLFANEDIVKEQKPQLQKVIDTLGKIKEDKESQVKLQNVIDTLEKLKEEKESEPETVINILKNFEDIEGLSDTNTLLIKKAISMVEKIRDRTRKEQELIYLFTRTVNRNIDSMKEPKYTDYKKSIYKITKRLREDTYNDYLFDHRNLSKIIESKLPILILDSQVISSLDDNNISSRQYRKEFKDELNLFHKKYLAKKIFKFDVGMQYSYLPAINYIPKVNVDISSLYSQVPIGREGRIYNRFQTDFSNISYPSIILSAEIPYASLKISIPTLNGVEKVTTVNSIGHLDLGEREAFYRNEKLSTLKVEYDIQLRFSIRDILMNTLKNSYSRKNLFNQVNFGIGIGTLGIAVEDEVTTDIRFITASSQTFNDIQNSNIIKSSSSKTVNVSYYSFFLNLEVNDTWNVGMTAKSYRDETESSGTISVQGESLAFSLLYRIQ